MDLEATTSAPVSSPVPESSFWAHGSVGRQGSASNPRVSGLSSWAKGNCHLVTQGPPVWEPSFHYRNKHPRLRKGKVLFWLTDLEVSFYGWWAPLPIATAHSKTSQLRNEMQGRGKLRGQIPKILSLKDISLVTRKPLLGLQFFKVLSPPNSAMGWRPRL